MADLENNTPRMMREMAQQLRQLGEEKLVPIPLHMRQLANQLDQQADMLEAEVVRGWLH